MTETAPLTVGRVAELVGISVRALHHWDEIGLVSPSGRSWAGYRLYDAGDIARIHRVLVYRELGLSLADVGRVLDDPTLDAREHLERQRDQLRERIQRLQGTVLAVETMIERIDMTQNENMSEHEAGRATAPSNRATPADGIGLSAEEQARIFGTDWDPAWQDEARERWGGTPQREQAARRTSAWGAREWEQVKADVDSLEADLAAALRKGVEPGSEEANALAERHRASIAVHYDCTHAMHVVFGRMYTEDPRFTAHYDDRAPGLAAWLRAVIEANARANGVDPEHASWG